MVLCLASKSKGRNLKNLFSNRYRSSISSIIMGQQLWRSYNEILELALPLAFFTELAASELVFRDTISEGPFLPIGSSNIWLGLTSKYERTLTSFKILRNQNYHISDIVQAIQISLLHQQFVSYVFLIIDKKICKIQQKINFYGLWMLLYDSMHSDVSFELALVWLLRAWVVVFAGVTVYLVTPPPPSILSPGTLYPVVKCPTLVYLVPGDTLPRGKVSPLKIYQLFVFLL